MNETTHPAQSTHPASPAQTDHNIWPALFSDDPMALRAWLGRLGFVEGGCYLDDDGATVHHSEMLWPEGGRVMLASPAKTSDGHEGADGACGPVGLYVVCDDPDAVYARAEQLGATVTRPLEDQNYGSRGFSILDPDGNGWSFGTYAG